MARAGSIVILTAESGLIHYFEQIRRFPLLERQDEYTFAQRWRDGDRDAAHRLVTSHLRLVAKIAIGYRGYGLPISEVISEGNVGLMQAVTLGQAAKAVGMSKTSILRSIKAGRTMKGSQKQLDWLGRAPTRGSAGRNPRSPHRARRPQS